MEDYKQEKKEKCAVVLPLMLNLIICDAKDD